MKGCVKVTISLMSNLTRTIKSLPLIAVLFTCVVILSSAAIFASEESTPSSEVTSDIDCFSSLVVPDEYKDPVYQYLASGDGVRAATYDTTDIYNLLSIALYNEGTTNTWSLPRIAYWTHMTKNNTDSIHQDLRELHFILNGDYSGIYVRPSIQESLFRVDSQGNFITLIDAISDFPSLTYSAINQVLGAQQNANYYLSQINSNLSPSISWTNCNLNYLGSSLSLTGSYLSSSQYVYPDSYFYHFAFSQSDYDSTPNLARFFIPLEPSFYESNSNSLSIRNLYIFSGSSQFSSSLDPQSYYFERTPHGVYLYLFDFSNAIGSLGYAPGSHLAFDISLSGNEYYFDSSYSGNLFILSFDSKDYQFAKSAFYSQRIAQYTGSSADDIHSISSNLSSLTNYLADPDKIAAEQASQGVIDDTLDGFTGSGSAAAKGSDIGSMKNISGSVQSGLDTGGSAGDAASVFTNANFWSWFTQSTSDGINNPYPAPTVEQRRGSGDEIPDFISGDHEELENYRNRGDRW